MSEIAILRALDCPQVAKLIDLFEDMEQLYIVQELIEGMSLSKVASNHCLNERNVQAIMKGLASGLRYLTECGVAHRDIKLENIMIGSKLDAEGKELVVTKYIDFGLSKVLLHDETSRDQFGTLAYCSPQIILGTNHTHQTDIWSLGVVLHVLLSRVFPFLAEDKNTTKRNIV